ncbi:MAG: minor capsid protein [Cyanobacteria bacterium P01_E01_bin.42]
MTDIPRNVEIATRTLGAIAEMDRDRVREMNRALVSSYEQLEGKLLMLVEAGIRDPDSIQIQLKKLNELTNAIAVVNPDAIAVYERELENLITEGQKYGIDMLEQTIRAYQRETPQFLGNVAIEPAANQVSSGMTRLRNHSDRAAQNINRLMTNAILTGQGPAKTAKQLQQQLGLLKSRAENIARTETMSAFNAAATERFSDYGIKYVQILALLDDRTTPVCRFRHMKIIRLSESQPPYHFQCRTVAMPIKKEWLTEKDMKFAAKEYVKTASGLNQASIFEQLNNIQPPSPVKIYDFLKS